MMKDPFVFLLSIIFILSTPFLTGCSKEGDIKIGEEPPLFSLPDINNEEITLADFTGRVILIRFWTVNCISCAKEMPELEEIYKTYKNKGLTIIGINVRQPQEVVRRFVDEHNLSFPIVLDTYSKTAKKYGIHGIPVSFIISRKGTVTDKIYGEIDKVTLEGIIVKQL